MSNYNFIDLAGKTFKHLTVVKRAENARNGRAAWKCQCVCGNTMIVRGKDLRSKNTQSCGCSRKKHGMATTSEYQAWKKIIARCCDPNCHAFKNYGGRGISICSEWRNDFMAFFNYVGKKPPTKHSIDRIDNNGNYKPGNVKWATIKEQNNNKRNNRKITIHNITMNLFQWASFVGINHNTIQTRLRIGWPPAKAIFCPVKKR